MEYIHSDLHPGNVICMKRDGQLKIGIIDFGMNIKLLPTMKKSLLKILEMVFANINMDNDINYLEYMNHFVNEPIVFKHRNTNKQLKPRRLNNRRGFVKMGDGSFQEVKMSIIPPPPKLSQEELNQMRESQIVKWGPQNRNAIYRIQRDHLKKYGNNLNWYHNPPPIVRYVPSHQLGEPIMEPFSTSK